MHACEATREEADEEADEEANAASTQVSLNAHDGELLRGQALAGAREIAECRAMDVQITADKPELEASIRQLIEDRLRSLATGLGPFTSARFHLVKAPWHSTSADYTLHVILKVPPSWTIEFKSSSYAALTCVDEAFVKLTGLIRRVIWERDGVPDPCRWCGGREFVFVPHPADQTESSDPSPMRLVRVNGKWLGELEVLVCRGCGHVEWFVSNPQVLPVGVQNIGAVNTRVESPFRGPG
jgi:ribosome-associated translation inhibitor RaiA